MNNNRDFETDNLKPGDVTSRGPVRKKQQTSFLQSIIGIFVGLGVIIFSPLVMWQAEHQDSAKEFAGAESVEVDSGAEGYIVFRGEPVLSEEARSCVSLDEGDKCLYENARVEVLETTQELVCENGLQNSEGLRVLEQDGYECDDDGDCTDCYQVEKDSWVTKSEDSFYNVVNVGGFSVDATGATLFDTREVIVYSDYDGDQYMSASDMEKYKNKHRIVYESYELPSKLLVAGQSDGYSVVSPVENIFVISSYDNENTFLKLQSMDNANKWMFRIVTFVMLFAGFSLVLGPLHWFGRKAGKIPFIGRFVADGSRFVLSLIAFVFGVAFWLFEFVVVNLIKYWWIIGILFAVVLLGVWVFAQRRDDR